MVFSPKAICNMFQTLSFFSFFSIPFNMENINLHLNQEKIDDMINIKVFNNLIVLKPHYVHVQCSEYLENIRYYKCRAPSKLISLIDISQYENFERGKCENMM